MSLTTVFQSVWENIQNSIPNRVQWKQKVLNKELLFEYTVINLEETQKLNFLNIVGKNVLYSK